MTVEQLLERYNGEIVRGFARVRIGRTYTVVGINNNGVLEITDAGRALAAGDKEAEIAAAVAEAAVAAEAEDKPARKRGVKAVEPAGEVTE